MDRNLDGVYFRIKRGEKYNDVCFSDLTEEQMDEILKGKTEEWLRNMCKILGKTIRKIGDDLDITAQ